MKNTLVKSRASFKQSKIDKAIESQKLVVFEMGKVNLALRIERVSKVLNQTTVYGSGLNGVGIAHVSDREVTVVDLHRRLFKSSLLNEASKPTYLILVKNDLGETYGIPIAAVPALMDVPLSTIRVLADSYRNADIFGFATHVCHLPDAEPPMTIFILDIEQLLASGRD